MGIYLKSGGLISPQYTHNTADFPSEVVNEVVDRLTCIEPDYKNLINPVLLRRMPRILKMGLGAAKLAIERAGFINPDGIIVGTGLGCLDNLEKFLMDMLENEEHITTVLPFINSTHNAVAAQISMLLKNQKYNTTYCHRSFSFETALLDGIMLIEEDPKKNILVGGIDECTPDFVLLHSYLNAWKKPLRNLSLLDEKSNGSIAGEGSGFFILSGEPSQMNGSVSLKGVHTFLTGESPGAGEIIDEIGKFLSDLSVSLEEVEGIILGINGDISGDRLYYNFADSIFSGKTLLYYKHLCGEYYTSGAFALWIASVLLGNNSIPDIITFRPALHDHLNNILIYNKVDNSAHSLIYLQYDRI